MENNIQTENNPELFTGKASECQGIIIGNDPHDPTKIIGVPDNAVTNRNVYVSGASKTDIMYNAMLLNIIQAIDREEAIVVIENGTDLYNACHQLAVKAGYTCISWTNTDDSHKPSCFPFDGICVGKKIYFAEASNDIQTWDYITDLFHQVAYDYKRYDDTAMMYLWPSFLLIVNDLPSVEEYAFLFAEVLQMTRDLNMGVMVSVADNVLLPRVRNNCAIGIELQTPDIRAVNFTVQGNMLKAEKVTDIRTEEQKEKDDVMVKRNKERANAVYEDLTEAKRIIKQCLNSENCRLNIEDAREAERHLMLAANRMCALHLLRMDYLGVTQHLNDLLLPEGLKVNIECEVNYYGDEYHVILHGKDHACYLTVQCWYSTDEAHFLENLRRQLTWEIANYREANADVEAKNELYTFKSAVEKVSRGQYGAQANSDYK